jgi:hypothetical protein
MFCSRTLSRVVEGSALRSHSNRFHEFGTLVLTPTPPQAGKDKARQNLFLSNGKRFFFGVRRMKKAHLRRCARPTRSNVLLEYASARQLSRAWHLKPFCFASNP